jgi:predicted O-methyltransferase YrrM
MGLKPSATTLDSELGADELSFLLDLVRRSNLRGRYLEIGTAAGGTLCQLMGCFTPNEMPQFVVVDPMTYFPDQLEVVKGNLRRHELDSSRVDFRIARSAEAFSRAEKAGERYDFMFIDGAHKLRYVTQDLRWTRLLNVGGLACLHDCHAKQKGVLWAANRFQRRHPNYRRKELQGTLLVLQKEAASRTAEIDWRDRAWSLVLAPWLHWERSLRKRLRRDL